MKTLIILMLFLALNQVVLKAIPIVEKEKAATQIDNMYSLDSHLEGVLHLPNGELLIYGSSGTIMKSKDLGINWEQRFSGTQRHIYDVKEMNQKLYAVGENGLYMTSIDFGKSWKILDFIDNEFLINIEFNNINSNEIVVSSVNGNIYFSENSGKDWKFIIKDTTITELTKTELKFNNDVIYYFNNNGKLSYSDDMGDNWNYIDLKKFDTINPLCTNCNIIDVQIKNDDFYILTQSSFIKINLEKKKYFNYQINQLPTIVQCFKLLENDEIALFTSPRYDKFLSYYQINSNDEINYIGQQRQDYLIERSVIKSGLILEDGTGLVVGANKTIFRTKDNGMNWDLISNIDVKYIDNWTNWIEGMKWVSDKDGYIYLKDKYFYRTTDAGVTWKPQKIGDDSNNIPREELIKLLHIEEDGKNILMLKKDPSSDNQYQNILYFSNDKGESFKNMAVIKGEPILNMISTKDFYFISIKSYAPDPIFDYTRFYKYDKSFKLIADFYIPKCNIDFMDIDNVGKLILFGEFYTYNLDEFPNFLKIKVKQVKFDIENNEIIDEIEFKGSLLLKEYYNIDNKKFLIFPDSSKIYRKATPDSSAGFVYNMCVYYCDNDSFDFELMHKDTTYYNFIPQNEKAYFLKEASAKVSSNFGKTFEDSIKVINNQISIKNIFKNSNNITYITTDCDRRFLLNKMILFRSIEQDFVSSVDDLENNTEDLLTLSIINAFPNPTQDNINVSILFDKRYNKEDAVISILDFLGKPINVQFELNPKSNFQSEIIINTQNLSTGMYLLNVKLGSTNETINFGVVR
jgi:photosystem II stability/assembly factor-like uncharacterized protein